MEPLVTETSAYRFAQRSSVILSMKRKAIKMKRLLTIVLVIMLSVAFCAAASDGKTYEDALPIGRFLENYHKYAVTLGVDIGPVVPVTESDSIYSDDLLNISLSGGNITEAGFSLDVASTDAPQLFLKLTAYLAAFIIQGNEEVVLSENSLMADVNPKLTSVYSATKDSPVILSSAYAMYFERLSDFTAAVMVIYQGR